MDRKGLVLVLLTAVISGVSIFANSFAVKGFDSSVFTFSKNIAVAALLLAAIMAFGQMKQLQKLTKTHWLQLAAIGLIGGSVPFLLFFKGLQMAAGATSGFIHKTMFIYVAIFAVVFLKEKLTKPLLAATALLLAGNYVMLRPSFAFSTGHLLIAAATLLWAVENTYAKHVLKQLSGNIVAFGRMLFGSLLILAFLAATGKTNIIFSMSPSQYLWVLFTALMLLVYVTTYYNGLKRIKVTTAAAILTLGSPITTALSLLQSKAVSPFEIAGALFIAAGAAVIIWASNKTGEANWKAPSSQ